MTETQTPKPEATRPMLHAQPIDDVLCICEGSRIVGELEGREAACLLSYIDAAIREFLLSK
jgi:hypothetical protein